uniref:Gag protease polyprotein n=1 Tax=Tanacetum cinerariifolium TaxID=118510 RepID=A0A6L2KJ10_TANCI|nr:Gag protease polyprotein [Tanacetum cinerariifolium]
MDFVTGLPQTKRRHDAIWVVVDRLTKSAHFLPIRKDYSVSRLAEIFQQEIIRLHGTPSAIVSDRDPRFASRFWKGLQKAWGTRLKFSTAFHPQTDGQRNIITNSLVTPSSREIVSLTFSEAGVLHIPVDVVVHTLLKKKVEQPRSREHYNQFTCDAILEGDYKEPPRLILTWEDLVLKFINQFFPPSKTTYLRNEITNFLQKPNETFNEAWERFKDLLKQCPHHGFSELHQLDTFYNALNPNDQDALDTAAGGNFLDKIPRECLSIIESKSKVIYSRSRVTDSRANTNAPLSSFSHSNSFDLQQIAAYLEDKLDIHMNRFEKSLNDMKAFFVTPTAPIKAF